MKVVLLCNSDGGLFVFRNPLIRALLRAGHDVLCVCPKGAYEKRLIDMGARLRTVQFNRHSISPVSNLKLLFEIWRIIRIEQPDVVHSFTHKAVVFGSLAARLGGVKRILATVTGLGTLFIRHGMVAQLMRRALIFQYRLSISRRITVLFQNPDDRDELISLGAVSPEQSVLTNGSGIDLTEYAMPSLDDVQQLRKALAEEIGTQLDGRMVVLFPARGVKEKGFFEFYEAAMSVQSSSPDRYVFLHLGLVDRDTLGHISAAEIAEFAQLHGVHYLGFKENLADYMSAADIVALPSYREGVPRSLIEALALGKVVVATDVPGCRETVLDGRNGFLFAPHSAEDLAKAIKKVDRPMIKCAHAISRKYCEERFDVVELNKLTFRLYGIRNGAAK